jgi:ribosome-binding factor A
LVIGHWDLIIPSTFVIPSMPSRRLLKAAEAIREVVGMAILTDLQDPRIRDVTVTGVEVAADMRQAKVYVSVMGNEPKQILSLRGLQNAAGFLQSKVAKRIDTRYTPKLLFVLDQGVKKSIEIAQILGQVLAKEQTDAKVGQTQAAAEDLPDDRLEQQPPDADGDESR